MNNKAIAQTLTTLADNYPPVPEVMHTIETRTITVFGGREEEEKYRKPIYKNEVILVDGSLTIKCLPFKECVLNAAEKYRKARAHSVRGVSCKVPSTKRHKFSWPAVKRFLEDKMYGLENAIAYMQLHDQPVYFMRLRSNKHELITDVVRTEGDFIQTKNGVITHVPSGMGTDKVKTIAEAKELSMQAINGMSEDDLKFQENTRGIYGCA